ncbi:MAG: hypothetical protein AB1481_07670 [Candidatus Omnitrophota bacterium]
MEKKALKSKITKLWKEGKKDVNIFLSDAGALFKKGELYVAQASKKGEKKVEAALLSLKKQRLCFELGQKVAALPRNKWGKSAKVAALLAKVHKASQAIRKLKR